MSTKFIKQFLGNHLHELIGFSFALGEDMSQCEGIVTDSILAYSFEQEMNHFDQRILSFSPKQATKTEPVIQRK